MKFFIFHRKTMADDYRKYSLWLPAIAAFCLIFMSCSSEEEPSQQARGQSSGQKQADQVKPGVPDQTKAVQTHIKAAIDQISQSKQLKIDETWLAGASILPGFYEPRNFRPAWTNPTKVKDLMQSTDKVSEDGLLPDDYHRRHLQALSEQIHAQSPPDPQLLAHLLRSAPGARSRVIRLLRMVGSESGVEETRAHLDALSAEVRIPCRSVVVVGDSFAEVLHRESGNAAVVMLGMADPQEQSDNMLSPMDNIAADLPRVLFVHSAGDMSLHA